MNAKGKMKTTEGENSRRTPGGTPQKSGQIKKGQKNPQIRYVGNCPVL